MTHVVHCSTARYIVNSNVQPPGRAQRKLRYTPDTRDVRGTRRRSSPDSSWGGLSGADPDLIEDHYVDPAPGEP
jgi:hypothetical protein